MTNASHVPAKEKSKHRKALPSAVPFPTPAHGEHSQPASPKSPAHRLPVSKPATEFHSQSTDQGQNHSPDEFPPFRFRSKTESIHRAARQNVFESLHFQQTIPSDLELR